MLIGFYKILFINLQFAANNSSVVENSKTIANKERKIQRFEFSNSLDVQKNDQRLVET